MKKKIISIIVTTASILASAAALSWGGMIDDNTKLAANNDFSAVVLNQSNGIYLNINSNLNEAATLRFSGEGLYKYELNCNFDADESSLTNILDVDLLKLSGDWTIGQGHLGLALGRFKFSDFSGAVFSQLSDGLYLSYDTLKIKTSLYAGYTGLLNRLDVSMTENEYEDGDQLYALCPKYVPLLADFSYKKLFELHTIGGQIAAYIPVTDENTLKLYGTLIANGYLGSKASYDARFTFGTEKFESLMMDLMLDANFYVRSDVRLTAGAEYVSGDQGSVKPFQTLSSRSFGNAPFVNGLIVPKFAVLYAAGKVYAGATERVIICMMEDETVLDGFDTTINVLYNIFSDLQIGLDAGAYICKENSEFTNFYATLKAVLAF